MLDGFITVDHARDDYGVVLTEVDDGYGWALDGAATQARVRSVRMASALEYAAPRDFICRRHRCEG